MKIENCNVLNVNEDRDDKGKLKRWQFEVSVSNNYRCSFFLNSFEFFSIPSFYAENRFAYKIDTGEPIENFYYKGETKANICMIIAQYIVDNLPEMKDWAKSYIENYNCIRNTIEQSEFQEKQTIVLPNKKEVSFTLCSQMVDKIESFDDIEFYLSHDDVFSGGDDLVKLACDAVNMEAIERMEEQSKRDLISFYQEHNIAKLFETSYDLLDAEERSDMELFSDWYKDIYHHRPRTIDNEVQRYLDSKNSNLDYGNEESDYEI